MQLPNTLPALGPGGVGHGRTSRPCNPVSARRARGLANASESQESRLCRRRTRLPEPRRRPARLPSLAPGRVGHGLTSARATQSCPKSLRSARSCHWEWCTINNELRTTSGRRVLGGRPRHGWVLATAATGRRQRPHLWVQTVAEGVVPPKEGCQAVRVVFRSLFGVARPAC